MYCHPVSGEIVPSVTTIMNIIAKPGLIGWSARQAAQYAVSNWCSLSDMPVVYRTKEIAEAHQRTAQAAADKGDLVHDMIDKWSKGVIMEPPKAIKGQVNQYVNFMMTEKPKFIENEVTVWSRTHGFAGTADWIAELDGKIVIGDNKTGKRIYPEVGLQLSALRHADFIIREDGEEVPMPPIEDMLVLHIRPRSYKLVRVTDDEANWSSFLAARTIYDWIRHSDPLGVVCGRLRGRASRPATGAAGQGPGIRGPVPGAAG